MGDFPREEIIKGAERVLRSHKPGTAEVHFKFTCANCGTRCTLQQPNSLPSHGECYQCGHETEITEGNYMVALLAPILVDESGETN